MKVIHTHLALSGLLAAGLVCGGMGVTGCGSVSSNPADDTEVYVSAIGASNPLFDGNQPIPVLAGRNAFDVVALRHGSASAAPRLYAVLEGSPGALAIVQTGTNQVVANIPVGNTAVAVAINQNATRAYVANFASDSVSVVDLTTNTVTATVALPSGARPVRLAACLDGKLYVSNRGNNTVSVVDMGTNTIVSTISPGTQPAGIAAHPDGGTVYVALNGSDAMAAIDTLTGTVGSTVAVTDPQDLAITSSGSSIAFTSGNASTARVDTTTMTVAGGSTAAEAGAIRQAFSPKDAYRSLVSSSPGRLRTFWAGGSSQSALPGTPTAVSYTRVVTNDPIRHVVDSSPSGLRLIVDGASVTAPALFTWPAGSQHTISAPTPQAMAAGHRAVWQSWSDFGAITHAVTAPATHATYTANFREQFELTTGTNPPFTGGLTVTAAPPSTDGYYDAGTQVTLTASAGANSGLVFGEWRDGVSGISNPEIVLMSGPLKATAFYDGVPLIGMNIGQRGPIAGGGYTHTAVLNNGRNEAYQQVRIDSIQWAVAAGTGTIVNTTATPFGFGALAGNGQTTPFTLTANIPGTITQWNVTLDGIAVNAAGRTLNWRLTGTVQR